MKEKVLITVSVKVIGVAMYALNDFLLSLSPEGVVEESEGKTKEWQGECASLIYLEMDGAKNKLKQLDEYLLALTDIWGKGTVLSYEVSEIGDEWKEKYQHYFKTKKVTDKVVVSPPWEDYQKREGEIAIRILPGVAFGTGTHETTVLSLAAIEEIFLTGNKSVSSILDVGCGSGILSIAGALLGANRVLGVESDRDAVDSAMDNVIRNDVRDIVEIRHENFGGDGEMNPIALNERFDIVVANLSGQEIKRVATSLLAFTAHQGHLILSGFLVGEKDEVLSAFGDIHRFSVIERTLGEWGLVHLKVN
jgi:ribosomal protein L11 methyltransferase